MKTSDLTSIGWIGLIKYSGDEWSSHTKRFVLEKVPEFATIRVDSQGVCGIFINGTFVETSCGRYCNRITYVEITSLLQEGENEIMLRMGSHFLQPRGAFVRERRGSWFSAAAAEMELSFGEEIQKIVTDESWVCSSDDGQTKTQLFSKLNYADYERFWKAAALIKEYRKPRIPQTVQEVAGSEYVSYATEPWQRFSEAGKILERTKEAGVTTVIYDYGRLQTGYLTIDYEAEEDGEISILCDYLEVISDFKETRGSMPWVVDKLELTIPIQKGRHTELILRRRSCHYLQMKLPSGVTIYDIRFRLSMTPSEQTGWFHSNEDMLNQMWEMGKYTLHVNKHQEYECCPRHEMKYFTGDGFLEALIDYYAFGDDALVDASLSLTEIACNSGIVRDVYEKNIALWDYVPWRIIMVYHQYQFFNDIECVKKYYDELVMNISWMMHKATSENLIYQYQLWGGPFYDTSESVEFTCSFDRLGEKPFLNALYYKCLLIMSELGKVMEDEQVTEWEETAKKVYRSFNERLWNEEKGAYLDTYDPSYIPQDGNAMAILFGLADERKTEIIKDTLKQTNWTPYGSVILSKETHPQHTLGGNQAISPLMQTMEIEARFQSQDGEGAMELIRRFWGTMLRKGAQTFWEYGSNDPEAGWLHRCHGWGGACTYLLSRYVLGVSPAKPGYETIHFEPYGGLEEYRGVVPTAKGLIAVKCTTVLGKKQYELAIPKGVGIETVLPDGAVLQIMEYETDF